MAVGTGVSVAGGSVAVGCSVADGCSVAVLVDSSVGAAFGALVAVALATATTGGMIAGLAVMALVWWGTSIAFTSYVLIGAVATCLVALRYQATSGGRA